MSHGISARSAAALDALFPLARGRPDGPTWLVDQLVDAELHRRGLPDASGAHHALALTQGALLKEEYDLSTHGHADGWALGAVLVDPLAMMRFNERYGFPAGDAVLRALVAALREALPTSKVVRLHTDGFAALLGPTSGQRADAALLPAVEAALTRHTEEATPSDGGPPAPLAFTVGALELTVVDPPHWQVLGPLAWAECERALAVLKRQPRAGLLRRTVVLDGRLPPEP